MIIILVFVEILRKDYQNIIFLIVIKMMKTNKNEFNLNIFE
jgi:hypothetical protein